jgi:hypothetical protein
LIYAIIASAENFQNLEQIRQDNLKRAGVIEGTPATKVAIVWFSYNVHGNEANSTETSFITRDSVEEKILVLQKNKLKLSEGLISNEESIVKSISRSDIEQLLA